MELGEGEEEGEEEEAAQGRPVLSGTRGQQRARGKGTASELTGSGSTAVGRGGAGGAGGAGGGGGGAEAGSSS